MRSPLQLARPALVGSLRAGRPLKVSETCGSLFSEGPSPCASCPSFSCWLRLPGTDPQRVLPPTENPLLPFLRWGMETTGSVGAVLPAQRGGRLLSAEPTVAPSPLGVPQSEPQHHITELTVPCDSTPCDRPPEEPGSNRQLSIHFSTTV